ASMQEGLARLESDFSFRLPQLSSEFGGIAKAINQMAERRVALEEGLRRQDRLSALGRAVGGVAHEIRNPLNSIRLTLELLERRLRRGAVTADEVAAAIKEVDRLDLILSRLLAFGRPELLDRHVQDVQPLIERACRMVDQPRREKNIEIRVDVEPDMRADVDGPQIEQVMINLLLNAVEASPPESPVAVHASRRNSHVHIAVEDRGPGVPEHARDHLFDAYFTTKENGNGLGLAVSREIVAQHGGQLSFEQTDAGAVFLIRLPVERSA
ncbi:MAG: ATP-binding protein, partial [Bryobacteraceae bacterium]